MTGEPTDSLRDSPLTPQYILDHIVPAVNRACPAVDPVSDLVSAGGDYVLTRGTGRSGTYYRAAVVAPDKELYGSDLHRGEYAAMYEAFYRYYVATGRITPTEDAT